MMTLEEAIKHCKDVALSCTNKECALEHFQLLKWLQEYSNMLEKQGEQKHINNVEPKFHKGEWVVINGFTILITDVRDDLYDTIFVNGEHRVYDTNIIDKDAHLWTIKDAKDGDVLAEDSCIFIIQKLGDNNTAAKTYYTLYDDGDFDDGTILYFDIDSTKPATKEQRDLLFSKMHKAGYTFDFETKELKKISQRMISAEAKESLYDKVGWNEEDERMLDWVIDDVRYFEDCEYDTQAEIDAKIEWLKSLKERLGGVK